MMKLLLTSSGITNETIKKAVVSLVGKQADDIGVGVINEAYAVEEGDKTWILDELVRLHEYFPKYIDIVNLLALSQEEVLQRLAPCDVIFVVGGHTDYLQSVFNASGFAELLPKLLEKKVYIGSSAGSMVVGKRISAEAYKLVYGEAGTYGTSRYMEMVDFALKPHFNSPLFPKNNEEQLAPIAKDLDFSLYAIDDATAIQVVDDEIKVVSEGKWKVFNK